MYRITHIIGACLLAAGLSGCGSSDFKPAEGMPANEMFAQACASCHGENGGGKFGVLLKLAKTEASAEAVVDKIRNGGHVMPAFPNISEAEAQALAAYVKGL